MSEKREKDISNIRGSDTKIIRKRKELSVGAWGRNGNQSWNIREVQSGRGKIRLRMKEETAIYAAEAQDSSFCITFGAYVMPVFWKEELPVILVRNSNPLLLLLRSSIQGCLKFSLQPGN